MQISEHTNIRVGSLPVPPWVRGQIYIGASCMALLVVFLSCVPMEDASQQSVIACEALARGWGPTVPDPRLTRGRAAHAAHAAQPTCRACCPPMLPDSPCGSYIMDSPCMNDVPRVHGLFIGGRGGGEEEGDEGGAQEPSVLGATPIADCRRQCASRTSHRCRYGKASSSWISHTSMIRL